MTAKRINLPVPWEIAIFTGVTLWCPSISNTHANASGRAWSSVTRGFFKVSGYGPGACSAQPATGRSKLPTPSVGNAQRAVLRIRLGFDGNGQRRKVDPLSCRPICLSQELKHTGGLVLD